MNDNIRVCCTFAVEFEDDSAFEADFGEYSTIVIGEEYTGEYTITPKTYNTQTLPTKNKLLTDDIRIKKIPYYEMDNESGGTTVYIGSDDEIITE